MDLDQSGFPNLALMKLSAFHKAKGDSTTLNFPLGAQTGYVSCVFSWNRQKIAKVPSHYQTGGSAMNGQTLPLDIEHLKPDYSLYGLDYSLGFTSRGCPRRCDFCIVPSKEGTITPWASIHEFWDPSHKHLRLLDNNLLAAPNWRQTLSDIRGEGIQVDFNQGLDIRLMTPEIAEQLYSLKLWGRHIYFAFDDIRQERAVHKGIGLLAAAGFKMSTLSFFVLFKPDGAYSDDVRRINMLAEYGVAVFPMFYVPPGSGRKMWDIPKMHAPDLGIKPFHGSRRGFNKLIRLLSWKKAQPQS